MDNKELRVRLKRDLMQATKSYLGFLKLHEQAPSDKVNQFFDDLKKDGQGKADDFLNGIDKQFRVSGLSSKSKEALQSVRGKIDDEVKKLPSRQSSRGLGFDDRANKADLQIKELESREEKFFKALTNYREDMPAILATEKRRTVDSFAQSVFEDLNRSKGDDRLEDYYNSFRCSQFEEIEEVLLETGLSAKASSADDNSYGGGEKKVSDASDRGKFMDTEVEKPKPTWSIFSKKPPIFSENFKQTEPFKAPAQSPYALASASAASSRVSSASAKKRENTFGAFRNTTLGGGGNDGRT